jgi:oligogalacturonide lyase
MSVGTVFPPERRTDRDSQTGRAVTQLTNSPAEDYHPCFYNPAVTRDGRYLIFFSERTGLSNLFRLDLLSGEIVQLTDVRPARAEYWPFTAAVRGAGACLAAIGSGGREAFYFEGVELRGVEIETLRARQLLTLPRERRPSILHADADGKTLVFATWDESLFMERSQRAYAGEQFPDDRFFQETTSTIIRLDAATGDAEEVLRRDKFWINHVLVNPHDRDLILFCHEYSGMPDRMWLLNVANGQCAPIPVVIHIRRLRRMEAG